MRTVRVSASCLWTWVGCNDMNWCDEPRRHVGPVHLPNGLRPTEDE